MLKSKLKMKKKNDEKTENNLFWENWEKFNPEIIRYEPKHVKKTFLLGRTVSSC